MCHRRLLLSSRLYSPLLNLGMVTSTCSPRCSSTRAAKAGIRRGPRTLATAVRDRGVALQAWLYHLLGSEASGLDTPESWRAGKSSKRLLSRVEVRVAAAAKECAQTAAQLRKLRSPGEEPRARAQLGWRMVQEAAGPSSRCSALAGLLRQMPSG